MRRPYALLMALILIVSLAACTSTPEPPAVDAPPVAANPSQAPSEEPTLNDAPIPMTYAEFLAAPLSSKVTVDTCIQDVEEWRDGTLRLYTQNDEGAYYIDSLVCTEEEAWGTLNPGAKIRVTGQKATANGQIKITDATFVLLENVNDANFAAPVDVTALARQGDNALIEKMNHWVFFKGLTVIPSIDAEGNEVPFLYKQDGSGSQGDDICFRASIGEQTYTFLVNTSMVGTGPQSEQYEAIEKNLQIGDVITIECYLCWNDGPQPHVTAVYPTN